MRPQRGPSATSPMASQRTPESLIDHVTGGRRYCFVIMSYRGDYTFYTRIKSIVTRETGLECIRADDVGASGTDLKAKIHKAIENASLVIAEISQARPNVYYEVGYALAHGRTPILLAQRRAKIHTDLVGHEIIRYENTETGIPAIENELKKHLRPHDISHISPLRSMLIPRVAEPSYIFVNPTPPGPKLRELLAGKKRRSYGDQIGIVRLLSVFGSVYGEHVTPELLNVNAVPPEYRDWEGNMYFIASPKSNRGWGDFLEELQRGREPRWAFVPPPEEARKSAQKERLHGVVDGKEFLSPAWDTSQGIPEQDYGLIVRGRHPQHGQHAVILMGGPTGLGTGAACYAATSTDHVKAIAAKLHGFDYRPQDEAADRAGGMPEPDEAERTATMMADALEALKDHERSFWALVRGHIDDHLNLDGRRVAIEAAGYYE